MFTIRRERRFDEFAREALLDRSFGPARRRKTSERLRAGRRPAGGLSFVATAGGALIGTVRLWNVSAGGNRPALLLGPLAVASELRGHGIGAALMRHAIARASQLGHTAMLLVGDAPYYARFGFSADLASGLWLPGPFARERFLAREITAGALTGACGLVRPTGKLQRRPRARHAVKGKMPTGSPLAA